MPVRVNGWSKREIKTKENSQIALCMKMKMRKGGKKGGGCRVKSQVVVGRISCAVRRYVAPSPPNSERIMILSSRKIDN